MKFMLLKFKFNEILLNLKCFGIAQNKYKWKFWCLNTVVWISPSLKIEKIILNLYVQNSIKKHTTHPKII